MITLPKKNCINCAFFAWWDGDYCCINEMTIFQEAKDGKMNETLLKALDSHKDCGNWKRSYSKVAYKNHIEKFKEAFKDYNDEGV